MIVVAQSVRRNHRNSIADCYCSDMAVMTLDEAKRILLHNVR